MKALVIKLSSLGDIVHSLPTLEVLSSIEGVEVHWVVEERFKSLLEGDPRIRGLMVFKKGHLKGLFKALRWPSLLRELKGFIGDLRSLRFDVLLDLQGDLKSALISLFVKSPVKLTFPDASEGSTLLLRRVQAREGSVHVVERYLDVVRYHFGLDLSKAPFAHPYVPEESKKRVLRRFGWLNKKRVVALIPLSTWASKMWPVKRWEELSWSLIKLGFSPVIVGGSDAKGFSIDGALNLAGELSLKDTCSFLSLCELTIGVDTGPTHISASLGVPTLALFGPTPPWRNSPWGPRVKVLYHSVGCNPCRRRSCSSGLCMSSISVEEVLQGLSELSSLAV